VSNIPAIDPVSPLGERSAPLIAAAELRLEGLFIETSCTREIVLSKDRAGHLTKRKLGNFDLYLDSAAWKP
jgi:hypothetical protein